MIYVPNMKSKMQCSIRVRKSATKASLSTCQSRSMETTKTAIMFLTFFGGWILAAEANRSNWKMDVGVILDANSRSGKEQKTAIEIAVQNFNSPTKTLTNQKLYVHFKDSAGDPLRAASAAEELIKDNGVKAIVGMDRWEEAALVGEVGSQARVPVISFATAAVSPPLSPVRWPFLVRMARNGSAEMECAAAIVGSCGWRRVILVIEDNAYGGDSGQIVLLSEALQDVGAEIEHQLILPSVMSVSDPKGLVIQELKKVESRQSRVFIVLQTSVSLAAHLFREAKQMGLMEEDSAWIVTNSVASLVHSFNSSLLLSLNGALGIKEYTATTELPQDFSRQFRRKFRSEYLEEDLFEPGIHALRAYDSITILTRSMDGSMRNHNTSSSKMLMQRIASSQFAGLSGQIRFDMGELAASPPFRILNFVGNGYKEVDFWLPGSGFSNSPVLAREGGIRNALNKGVINWPGDVNLNHVPKGWAMPVDMKRLKIGVPGRTSFEKFVKVELTGYSGFCIDVFNKVVERVGKKYALPYDLYPCNCTYDELVDLVYNKSLDAAVGDITILALRMEHVDFTQPFAESGLSMIVPVKPRTGRAWIFLRPFTMEMWMVTGALLLYTMFIVWFLEHRTNPQFRGAWKDQLGTALWFTFSSLFFAHREKIQSNFTRVVVVVWLFVVLILTSSYTASLSSMLTVQRFEPNVTNIDSLRNTNQKIGCDGDSFVKKYLENVLGFKKDNILTVRSEYLYPQEFQSENITAAFLELPYAKAFLNQYCKGYTVTSPTYRFGGLAFAFQKGSPLTFDFSEAILQISEDGTLKRLEDQWFSPSPACKASINSTETDSLSLQSFWGLYAITGGTSALCLLLFVTLLVRSFCRQQEGEGEDDVTPRDDSIWNKAKRLAQYFHDAKAVTAATDPEAATGYDDGRGSPQWVCVTSVTPGHPHASPDSGIEML